MEKDTKDTNNEEQTNQNPTQDDLNSLRTHLTQLKDSNLRLQAEFANYKRRNESVIEDSFNKGVESVFSKLIDVFDDFNLALSNKDAKYEDFKKGIELVYAKLIGVSEEFNIYPIECLGKQFDPKEHEALLTEKSDKPENQIIEELQKGYKMNDAILRHSKVKVARK